MSKFLGNAKVKVNSKLVKTVPGSVKLSFGGKMRESVMADDTFNFNEKAFPAKLEFNILHTAKTDIKVLNELQDGTVEIITDIAGVSYTLTSATRMGEPLTTSDDNGQIPVTLEGDPITP